MYLIQCIILFKTLFLVFYTFDIVEYVFSVYTFELSAGGRAVLLPWLLLYNLSNTLFEWSIVIKKIFTFNCILFILIYLRFERAIFNRRALLFHLLEFEFNLLLVGLFTQSVEYGSINSIVELQFADQLWLKSAFVYFLRNWCFFLSC